MNDPRDKNEPYDKSSVTAFVGEYLTRLSEGLNAVSAASLERAIEVIEKAAKNRTRIYSIGNGGSAAIADHLCCDWTKGTDVEAHQTINTTSLNANMPLYSAIANDFTFSEVFSKQIEFFGQAGDLLISISSSGNSENIIRATEVAKSLGLTTIALTGFSGGRLREIADVSLHVPVENYGVVEDAHQTLMHVIAQLITARRLGRK